MTTTWNPSDADVACALSNANLTATCTGGGSGFRGVRATISITGLKYWEITHDLVNGGDTQVGVANGTAGIFDFGGGVDNDSISYNAGGTVNLNGSSLGSIGSYTTGDVTGIAYDSVNSKIWFRKNGGNWDNNGTHNPATNTGGYSISAITGADFPYVNVNTNGSASTVNFGATAFVTAPPSGFTGIDGSSTYTLTVGTKALSFNEQTVNFVRHLVLSVVKKQLNFNEQPVTLTYGMPGAHTLTVLPTSLGFSTQPVQLTPHLLTTTVTQRDILFMDLAQPAEMGIWIDDDQTFQAAMDAVAGSVGAYYSFDYSGLLRLGILNAPVAIDSILTIRDYDLVDIPERVPPKDNGVPAFNVTVNYAKIWTIQDSDLASVVTPAARMQLAQEYRSVKAEDLTVKNQWLMALEIDQDTLMADIVAATTEANRLLSLYKVRRDIFNISVPMDLLTDNQLRIGSTVRMVLNRFNMSAGKYFLIIGTRIELETRQAGLTLWG